MSVLGGQAARRACPLLRPSAFLTNAARSQTNYPNNTERSSWTFRT
jgi:hypothetical protein